MILGLLSLLALIGAPLAAGFVCWRVYTGAPWLAPYDYWGHIERVGIAATIAVCVFSGWLGVCHSILEAIKQ